MPKVASKEAARRFHHYLRNAGKEPVLITRYGKIRGALISVRVLELVALIIDERKKDLAVEALEASLEEIRAGKLRTAARLRKNAEELGRMSR